MSNIQIINDIAWADERYCCSCLVSAWREGEDTGERCARYLQRQNRGDEACHSYGGLCAFDDPAWCFLPGWAEWAEYHIWWQVNREDGEYLTGKYRDGREVESPCLKTGDLVQYGVDGDSMLPTFHDGQVVTIRIGRRYYRSGAICVIRFRDPNVGLPTTRKTLKRLFDHPEGYLVKPDNPEYPPCSLPKEGLHIIGVVDAPKPGESLADIRRFDKKIIR